MTADFSNLRELEFEGYFVIGTSDDDDLKFTYNESKLG